MTTMLEYARINLENAGDRADEGRKELMQESLSFANTHALISIAESLAKLAGVVVPDSAEGYPPALNVMDTGR